MDIITNLYKVGETSVCYGAVSCSKTALGVIVTKAKSIAAFVSATGDSGFVDIRFHTTRKDGSEFTGQFFVAPAPVRVSSGLGMLLSRVETSEFVDCTGLEDSKGLRVRPVKNARMSTNGDHVWFSGIIDNAVVETGRIPVSALDDTESS